MGVQGDGAERGAGGCIERHDGDKKGVVFFFLFSFSFLLKVWRRMETGVFAIG